MNHFLEGSGGQNSLMGFSGYYIGVAASSGRVLQWIGLFGSATGKLHFNKTEHGFVLCLNPTSDYPGLREAEEKLHGGNSTTEFHPVAASSVGFRCKKSGLGSGPRSAMTITIEKSLSFSLSPPNIFQRKCASL